MEFYAGDAHRPFPEIGPIGDRHHPVGLIGRQSRGEMFELPGKVLVDEEDVHGIDSGMPEIAALQRRLPGFGTSNDVVYTCRTKQRPDQPGVDGTSSGCA
jgi:hypothetical protein